MKPMPIRYVRDMDAARRFYEALGLTLDFVSRPPRRGPSAWAELRGDGGGLALHHAPPEAEPSDARPSEARLSEAQPHDTRPPGVELSFEADEPLEQVVERLLGAGYEPATAIVDESFGRSFTVRDPEGLLIQVNELDRELQS